MKYTSTVTSKGTITLPASIRAKLGITSGNEVEISLKGDTIAITPKGGWEQLVYVGAEIRQELKKRGVKTPINIESLRKDTERIKAEEYRQKYLDNDHA